MVIMFHVGCRWDDSVGPESGPLSGYHVPWEHERGRGWQHAFMHEEKKRKWKALKAQRVALRKKGRLRKKKGRFFFRMAFLKVQDIVSHLHSRCD